MTAVTVGRPLDQAHHPHLDVLTRTILAAVCLAAGFAPLAAHWIPDDAARTLVLLALTTLYVCVALFARTQPSLQQFWELAFALFVFAFVFLLNSTIPGFVATTILRDPPNAGNPFASTIAGTVIVQLVETLLAIVPVIVFIKLSGRDLRSIYVRKGIIGKWLLIAVVFFALFYVFTATIPLRPGSFAERLLPTNGTVTLARFIAFSPALIVISLSNGFEEEFVFRGLLLSRFNWFFNPWTANILQAAIFSFAHLGVTYTPSALVFVVIVVLPLGLVAGYLTRATNSLLTPAIFHGALDMAIYVTFLSYAS
jgi:membrane protease YdiL (CAAX protease family)